MQGVHAATLVLDALRGGRTAFQAEREIAEEIEAAYPGARRTIRWADRFAAYAAELAVTSGLGLVVFGGAGYPAGDQPHHAAAVASATARFYYPSPDPVMVALRGRSLEGDRRAVALRASVRDAGALLGAAWSARPGDGRMQVQLGLTVSAMTSDQAAQLAMAYARLLPSGSQLTLLVAEPGGIGDRLGEIAGGRAHTAADAARWLERARFTVRVADVRAWGRQALAAGLPPKPGRIMGLVADVP